MTGRLAFETAAVQLSHTISAAIASARGSELQIIHGYRTRKRSFGMSL